MFIDLTCVKDRTFIPALDEYIEINFIIDKDHDDVLIKMVDHFDYTRNEIKDYVEYKYSTNSGSFEKVNNNYVFKFNSKDMTELCSIDYYIIIYRIYNGLCEQEHKIVLSYES